jgi:hypothetical protein
MVNTAKRRILSSHRINRCVIILFTCASTLVSCAEFRVNLKAEEHLKYIEYSRANSVPVLSMDTLYSNGKSYGLAHDESMWLSYERLVVYPLQGQGHIDISDYHGGGQSYYRFLVNNASYRDSAFVRSLSASISEMFDDVVQYDLLTPDGINIEKCRSLVQANPFGPIGKKQAAFDRIVIRDHTKPVKLFGDSILQDGKVIGLLMRDETGQTGSGDLLFRIAFADGYPCAIANANKFYKTVRVHTIRDERNHSLESDPAAHPVSVLMYLINNDYL